MGNNNIYEEATIKLGKWIVSNNNTLIYGGSKSGLMDVLASVVMKNGGKAIGVIPKFLMEIELAHEGLTQLIKVEDMSSRKKKMVELGDVYIALPGGPGTLEEISEVISWSRLGKNNNPCILFNENNYYDNLKHQYDLMVKEGFLSQDGRDRILFSNDLNEIDNFIKNYKIPEIRKYDRK